jgi:cytochrome b
MFSFTGRILHEWLGLAMVGMVFAHLLLAWSWMATQSRRLFVQSARERINYLLNLRSETVLDTRPDSPNS